MIGFSMHSELNKMVEEFKEALNDELMAVKKAGYNQINLVNGFPIESHGMEFLYSFSLEYDKNIPVDTPCKLIIDKKNYDVYVVNMEEKKITLSSRKELPIDLKKAKLENDLSVLIELLIKRIQLNLNQPNLLGEKIFLNSNGYDSASIDYNPDRRASVNVEYNPSRCASVNVEYNPTRCASANVDSNRINNLGIDNEERMTNLSTRNAAQLAAICSALQNSLTYIWGPPGTGKTAVIADIVEKSYHNYRSVLIISHTNVAVDGVLERLTQNQYFANISSDEIYPILRYGNTSANLDERVYMAAHVKIIGAKLMEQRDNLRQKKEEIEKRYNEIKRVLYQKEWCNNTKISLLKKLVKDFEESGNGLEQLRRIERNVFEKRSDFRKKNKEIEKIESLKNEIENVTKKYREFLVQEKEIEKKEFEKTKAKEQIIEEIEKHIQYKALKAEQRNLYPQEKIRNHIQVIEKEIAELVKQQQKLKEQKNNFEKIVKKYTQNTIKKLLGKNKVENAKSQLNRIETYERSNQKKIEEKKKLLENIQKQLEKRKRLEAEIEKIVLKETKEYWENQLGDIKVELVGILDHKQFVIKEKEKANDLLEKMSEKKTKEYETYVEIEKELQKIQEQILTNERNLMEKSKKIKEELEFEMECCLKFDCNIEEKDILITYQNLEKKYKEIKEACYKFNDLELQKEKDRKEEEIKQLAAQMETLEEQIVDIEKDVIKKARILGTTLTKAYISDILQARKFDTVIVDEASMAIVPALWCVSYLAKKSFVIVGDFLQLSPIVISQTPMANKWLKRDIFSVTNIKDVFKVNYQGKKRNNCIMLQEQYRMERDIATIANQYYGAYGGLISRDDTEKRIKEREKFYLICPKLKNEKKISVIDTQCLNAWTNNIVGKTNSKMNYSSAILDVEIAFQFIGNVSERNRKNPTILIITPFKAQIELLKKLIVSKYEEYKIIEKELQTVKAGTIHSFQGSEADIVIFDLVVDKPLERVRLFQKNERVSEDLRRMINVAVTRAKFKLYIVGNVEYCQQKAGNNVLGSFLNYLINDNKVEKAAANIFLKNIKKTTFVENKEEEMQQQIICREDTFWQYLKRDIKNFKERMIIYSPFITTTGLKRWIPEFLEAINMKKEIIVVTKSLYERNSSEIQNYLQYEKELKKVGVKVIYKKGMHEKNVFIDDTAIWNGSLNILSFSGYTGEFMFRMVDKNIIEEIKSIFKIESICQAIAKENTTCPICGKPLQIEDKNGIMYLQCINKDFSKKL